MNDFGMNLSYVFANMYNLIAFYIKNINHLQRLIFI